MEINNTILFPSQETFVRLKLMTIKNICFDNEPFLFILKIVQTYTRVRKYLTSSFYFTIIFIKFKSTKTSTIELHICACHVIVHRMSVSLYVGRCGTNFILKVHVQNLPFAYIFCLALFVAK